uniref:EGF-like domain-containing protein n=1 Tax=Poecilia latipinna TaxID=48699 RepID=A0A3B3UTD6_9TELE
MIPTNLHKWKPTCRCPVGYSGPFCEKRICDNYCLNGGTCDVTQGNQPVCRCMAEYTGDRCLYREFFVSTPLICIQLPGMKLPEKNIYTFSTRLVLNKSNCPKSYLSTNTTFASICR